MNIMREITTILLLLISVLSIAKYAVIPVTATNINVNQYMICIDSQNNKYLCENVAPGEGYTLLIDRHNVFNSEDNEILKVIH